MTSPNPGPADEHGGAPLLPAEVLAGHARRLAEAHKPGGLYAFETLYPDGDVVGCGTHAMIDPGFNPARIPDLMFTVVSKELGELGEGSPEIPCAFALLVETLEGPAAFGQRRCVRVMICDVHGRAWQALRDPAAETITERHAEPGDETWIGNEVDAALLSVARVTGILIWGLQPADDAEAQVIAEGLRRA